MARRRDRPDEALLSPQEWRFCREYVFGPDCGRRGKCWARASREPDENGEIKVERSDHARAAHLLSRPEIQQQINENRQELAESEQLTPEGHLAVLRDIREKAIAAGDFKAATNAETQRGKAAGYYVERHLIQHESATKEQVAAELRSLLEQNPEIAELFAGELKELPVQVLPGSDADPEPEPAEAAEPAQD